MADDKALRKTREQRRTSETAVDNIGLNLIEVATETWVQSDVEQRKQLLIEIDTRYREYLDELYKNANLCVERYGTFSLEHTKWRRRLIIGTGIVAIVNLVAANKRIADLSYNFVPIAAAVCALALAILANLESFYNWLERAQAYRESRELFLDAAREFDRVWDVYVRPFEDKPEACANAVELYKRIVAKDRELRSKFKELTKTEKKARP
jgi:hypothetical protein